MDTQKDIKRKIKAVLNIQKVTKAMETMASIKYQKSMKLALSARSFSDEIYSFVQQMIKYLDEENISEVNIYSKNSSRGILFVAVSTDRGLCGPLNTIFLCKVLSAAETEKKSGRDVNLIVLGKKGIDFFRNKQYKIISSYDKISSYKKSDLAKKIIKDCTNIFLNGLVGEVYVFYNHFISAVKNMVSAIKLLPINFDVSTVAEHIPARPMPLFESDYKKMPYILPPFVYEPSLKDVLNEILVKYLETMIIQVLLEADASENSSRMIAMQQATINANDMLTKLGIRYNKARQMLITKDIIEIVNSSEALK